MEEKKMNYSKLKQQMRQLIRLAKEVIEETEKDAPDDILICDLAVEEMDSLVDQISSTVLRFDRTSANSDINS